MKKKRWDRAKLPRWFEITPSTVFFINNPDPNPESGIETNAISGSEHGSKINTKARSESEKNYLGSTVLMKAFAEHTDETLCCLLCTFYAASSEDAYSFSYEAVLWLWTAVIVMNPLQALPLTSHHNNKDVHITRSHALGTKETSM